MIVDPPTGWRYGFPRVYDPNPGESFKEWLIRHGYPNNESMQRSIADGGE